MVHAAAYRYTIVVISCTGTEYGCGGSDQDHHLNNSNFRLLVSVVQPLLSHASTTRVVVTLALMYNLNFNQVKVLDLAQASRGREQGFHVTN